MKQLGNYYKQKYYQLPFCNVGLSRKLFLAKRRLPMCKLPYEPLGKTNCRVLTAKNIGRYKPYYRKMALER